MFMDTNVKRKDRQKLEQYYTPSKVAKKGVRVVLARLRKKGIDVSKVKFLEPCAGKGVFIDALVAEGIPRGNILAYDLDPKRGDIEVRDVFSLTKDEIKGYVVITNLPFGKACSLSKRITKHLFKCNVDEVYQIAPISMPIRHSHRKTMSGLKGEQLFEMGEDEHFEIDDVEYSDGLNPVRCSFQRWSKTNEVFTPSNILTPDWIDVTPKGKKVDDNGVSREVPIPTVTNCDLVLISHGTRAGEVLDYNPKETYKANVRKLIKVTDGISVEEVKSKFLRTDYSKYKGAAALTSAPSLTTSEVIECYLEVN